MATLTVQDGTSGGLEVTFAAAAAGGDDFLNDGKTILRIKNGGGSDITVTINSQTPCNYGFDHDEAEVVTAAEERDIGPFPQSRWNDASGKVKITYSAVTSVTVAAISY